jgi:hypothetical protein
MPTTCEEREEAHLPILGGKVSLVAGSAIALRFAVLAAFTALSPASVLASVLWAATLVQLLARIVDGGLPNLLRIVLVRAVGRHAVACPAMWVVYFSYTAVASGLLILPVYLIAGHRGTDIPILVMALHCACVAVNNMYLAQQLAQERQGAIALNLISPQALPLLIVAFAAVIDPNLFSATMPVYVIYAAGDVLVTVASMHAMYRGRHLVSMRRVLRALRLRGTPKFLALSWSSGLVKLVNQKAERLLAFGFLSPEAYVVTSYILAMRDGISGVAEMSIYKQFNSVLRKERHGPQDSLIAKLPAPTILVLVASILGAVALWWCLPWVLTLLHDSGYHFDVLSIAIMLSGILPFIYIQMVGQVSVAERSQSFNFFCQIALIGAMMVAQFTAASIGYVPVAWIGPHLAAVVLLVGIARFGRYAPATTSAAPGAYTQGIVGRRALRGSAPRQ